MDTCVIHTFHFPGRVTVLRGSEVKGQRGSPDKKNWHPI